MNNLCAWSERLFKAIKWQTTRHILNTFKRLTNKRSNGSAPAKTSPRLVFGKDGCGGRLGDCIVLSVVAASCPRQTEAQVKMLEWCQSATYRYSNNNYGAAFFSSEGRHPHFLIELNGHRVYESDWSRVQYSVACRQLIQKGI